jgi:thioredoxin-related protein
MKRITALLSVMAITLLAQGGNRAAQPATASTTTLNKVADSTALHYWEAYNLGDTLHTANKELWEQGFKEFAHMTSRTEQPRAAFERMAAQLVTNEKTLDYFTLLAEEHLADSHSPLYNEELYITMLESIIADKNISSLKRDQVSYQLDMALKNRIGSEATDIMLLTRDNSYIYLNNIRGEYILLYLGDPDCSVCNEAKEKIIASQAITEMVQNHRLMVVSVCVEGKTDTWETTPAPGEWIDTCDEQLSIYEEELYDMAAIPSFYLLDSNKHVILRDVHAEYVIEYLKNL